MTRNSRRNISRAIGAIEFVGFIAANLAAQKLTPWASRDINGNPVFVPLKYPEAIIFAICVAIATAALQLRRPDGTTTQRRLVRLFEAMGGLVIGMLVFLALFAIFEYQLVGRYIVVISAIGSVIVVGICEWFRSGLISDEWRRVLFVVADGSSEMDRQGIIRNARQFPGEYRFEGISSFSASPPTATVVRLKEQRITDVVFDYNEKLRRHCSGYVLPIVNNGIRVLGLETLLELYSQKLDLRLVDEAWFLTFENDLNGRLTLRLKRGIDIIASLVILALCAPLVPLIATAVKMQDGGPIMYKQRRKGRNGQIFDIWKFRTMRTNSEAQGAVWAAKGDSRVTRIGRVLRKTRMDEIPQLINILRGEMSFVGPRPERPELVQEIVKEVPQFELRELVKPGLTGWAQVKYPYGASIEDAREKLAYDLYYIKHASMSLDLYVIAKTVFVVSRGSR